MFMVIVGSVDELIDGLSFMSFIFYALCIVAVLILRVTHHKEPRLFKVCGLKAGISYAQTYLQLWFIMPVAVSMTCFCLFVVFVPLLSAPIPLLMALGFLILGVPVYFILVMDDPWKVRPRVLDKMSGKCSYSYILLQVN